MSKLHTAWRTALACLATGTLFAVAGAAFAQEAPAASSGLWEKLDALRRVLAPDAVALAVDDDAEAIAQNAKDLLLGTETEVGIIALLQQETGVSAEGIGDAAAVVAAGNAQPEVVALAHLLLAAEALTASTDAVSTSTALGVAGQHVDEASKLLASLRPDTASGE